MRAKKKPGFSHQTIFKCSRCRVAWQIVRTNANSQRPGDKTKVEYYPTWIAGDVYKTCPRCESDLKQKSELKQKGEKNVSSREHAL